MIDWGTIKNHLIESDEKMEPLIHQFGISPLAKKTGFKVIDLIYENIEDMEKHGIKDQGITRSHEFLILKKS